MLRRVFAKGFGRSNSVFCVGCVFFGSGRAFLYGFTCDAIREFFFSPLFRDSGAAVSGPVLLLLLFSSSSFFFPLSSLGVGLGCSSFLLCLLLPGLPSSTAGRSGAAHAMSLLSSSFLLSLPGRPPLSLALFFLFLSFFLFFFLSVFLFLFFSFLFFSFFLSFFFLSFFLSFFSFFLSFLESALSLCVSFSCMQSVKRCHCQRMAFRSASDHTYDNSVENVGLTQATYLTLGGLIVAHELQNRVQISCLAVRVSSGDGI